MSLALEENVEPIFADAIHLAKTDPESFVENVLGVSMDPWQVELIQAALDVERFNKGLPTVYNHKGLRKLTVRAMHGPGKTFGVALLMHLFNFIYRGRIIATAPKEKQLITRLWPAFRKIKTLAIPLYQQLMEVDTTRITWVGDPDWVALAETAAQPENLAGYHDDYLLFIVEEASGVSEELFPVIEGALSTGIVVILVMISNPTKNTGTFYDSHCRERVSKHYYKLHVSLDKTTRVSRQWVQEMIDKYGKESPVVRIRCLGEFAEDDVNQLLSLAWIETARANGLSFVSDGSIPRLRITVDVADGGEDDTVVTVAKVYDSVTTVMKKYRFNFPSSQSPILAAKAAMQVADDWEYNSANGDDIVVDSIGVGAGTAGYIIDSKRFNVITYKGGESSDDSTSWRNRRVQSYIGLRDAMRDEKIVYLESVWDIDKDWEDHIAQLCSVRTKEGSEKVEDLMTKKEMKALGIKSPDTADGDAMLYATQTPTIGTSTLEAEIVGSLQSTAEEF